MKLRQTGRQWLGAVALMALLAALHGGRPLLLGRVPPDERLIHLPNCFFSWQCLTEGVLPLWNPYMFCGLPHLASHHAGALYAPVYFFFALFEPFRAFSLMQDCHYFLAGLGMWALLRYGWRLRHAAALAGGVFFMLSGFNVSHEGHSPMIWAIAWLPWLMWVSRRTLAGRPGAAPLLALLLAVQTGAGYMQITVLTCLALGGEALALALRQPWGVALRRLAIWGAAMAVGTGLMAVQFLSTREMLTMTFRQQIPFGSFISHALPPAQLPTLFFPLLYGAYQPFLLVKKLYFAFWDQPEVVFSMGAAAWAGVLLLCFRAGAPRTEPRLLRPGLRPGFYYWSVMAVFCALLLLGDKTPLPALLYRLPVVSLFRVQNRWMIFANFWVALAAALGYDRLLGRLARREALRLGAPLLAGLALLLAAIPLAWLWIKLTQGGPHLPVDWTWFFHEWFRLTNPALWLPVAFGLAALGLLLILWKRPAAWKPVFAGLIALYALEQGILTAQTSARITWPSEWYTAPGNETVTWLSAQQPDPGAYRILTPTPPNVLLSEETLIFTEPQLNGIYSVGGNWPLMSPVHGDLLRMSNVGTTLDPVGLLEHRHILDMLNVRYLPVGHWFNGWWPIPPYSPALPETEFMKTITTPGRFPWLERRHQTRRGVTIFENTAALPRAWSVSRLIPAASPQAIVQRLWSDEPFDPAREAFFEADDRLAQAASREAFTTATVRVTRREADKLWLKVSASAGPAFVVLSEAWYPGWWARLDGQPIPIHRVNATLRGLRIPQGEHEIYLRFLPDGFIKGLAISLLFAAAWLAWVGWAMIQLRRRRRGT